MSFSQICDHRDHWPPCNSYALLNCTLVTLFHFTKCNYVIAGFLQQPAYSARYFQATPYISWRMRKKHRLSEAIYSSLFGLGWLWPTNEIYHCNTCTLVKNTTHKQARLAITWSVLLLPVAQMRYSVACAVSPGATVTGWLAALYSKQRVSSVPSVQSLDASQNCDVSTQS